MEVSGLGTEDKDSIIVCGVVNCDEKSLISTLGVVVGGVVGRHKSRRNTLIIYSPNWYGLQQNPSSSILVPENLCSGIICTNKIVLHYCTYFCQKQEEESETADIVEPVGGREIALVSINILPWSLRSVDRMRRVKSTLSLYWKAVCWCKKGRGGNHAPTVSTVKGWRIYWT